jgi:hypothetical protein
MKKPIPIIGKTYHYFDDGKIKVSRRGEVVITEVIPFKDIDQDTLNYWQEEVEECDWLYAPKTDFFVKSELTLSDGSIRTVIFVRTIDDDWFSLGLRAGRLDIDGSLNDTLNKIMKMGNIKLTSPIPEKQNTIRFMQDNGAREILKLCENGDIFVKGKLAENDKEVVDALREFIKGQGFLK